MSTQLDPQDSETRNRRPLVIAAIVVGIVLVAAIGGVVWYLNQDAPEEVSLESAVEDVSGEDASGQDASEQDVSGEDVSGEDASDGNVSGEDAPAAVDGIEGTWTIDTSVGEFSFEDATSSFAGFRIEEELSSLGAVTAVGRTPEVSGSITIEGTTLVDATIEADLTAIVTNNSRRDNAVQRALNTAEHPLAVFVITEPIDLGDGAATGEDVSVVATGELTINGITQPIDIPIEAQLVGDLIVVVGSTEITFADWDVEVPSSPAVVSVDDFGVLEMQLFFAAG